MEADLILAGGRIRTPAGPVQAMAVVNGVIIALGTNIEIAAHVGAGTHVIELDGAVVLPGLHDLHLHPMSIGLQAVYAARIPVGADRAALQRALRE
ncbi:MAG TPA: amidohydrolase, partial [Microbacterium sp.]|nr:amidohydrolase [Microbacterium sp.]